MFLLYAGLALHRIKVTVSYYNKGMTQNMCVYVCMCAHVRETDILVVASHLIWILNLMLLKLIEIIKARGMRACMATHKKI